MQCPTCKQDLEEGTRFCPHDGTPLTETSAMRTVATPTHQRPPTREIELPVVVGNRYRLEEARGGGGMARVYKGVDVTLEREVAVKLINPELRAEPEFDERFKREARIASQLADPHIVVVHDFGIDPAQGPYLVMEFLQGQSLRERLNTGGPLPLKAGLQLAGQLLLALIHAHGKNIVHRDIKPDNVFLLNQSGVRLHVRVLDFGIARIYRAEDAGGAETITHAGAVLGTPRYMSPEQLAGRPVDARSDIYSAALVIHEALTGQLPYVGGKKLTELCPDATPALQDLLDQCLRPNPAERPPTAVEVYLRLQELGKASGILLLPPGAMDRLVAARKASEPTVAYTPPGGASWRRRLVLGALALLALAGLGMVARALFFPVPSANASTEESLLGVKVGDPQDEVIEQLKLKLRHEGDPWKAEAVGGLLGAILAPADLRLGDDPGALTDLETWGTPDRKVYVLFYRGKVRAVLLNDRTATTARGMHIPGDLNGLEDRYPDGQQVVQSPLGKVYRYDALGILFLKRGGPGHEIKVCALYPPKKP